MAKVAPKRKNSESDVVDVAELRFKLFRVNLVGTSPFVPHAVSVKAQQSLILPSGKKTEAEKATTMKHDPYQEFVDAAYKFRDIDRAPTRLYMKASAFHNAMASAALDMAGARKAQIGRLTKVKGPFGEKIPIWGIPQIFCDIVRSSDMARTPDVRTLPILPQWATTFDVEFAESLLKEQSIANLLAAAGSIVGVGDGRPEKGKLAKGCFRLCSDDDPQFRKIVAAGAIKQQDAAMNDPEFYDDQTEYLLTWFEQEVARRGAAPVPPPRRTRMRKAEAGGNGAEPQDQQVDPAVIFSHRATKGDVAKAARRSKN